MTITAKHIQRSNIMLVYPAGTLKLPEPTEVFNLYSGKDASGSVFSDTPSLGTRIFEFPVPGFQIVFEPDRLRLEDKSSRQPKDSRLASELQRIITALYSAMRPTAFGFNYDIIYRLDAVVPVREIMSGFLKPSLLEDIKDFGWQYTLNKNKGKQSETYFFKVVSPIEYGVHANFHFNESELPKSNDLQTMFERCYTEVDESINHIKK